jgi:hypothetical protein
MQPITVEQAINFEDNSCRYDGNKNGYYEVWFLTLNDRATRRGFWFRYTIDVLEGRSDPQPGLWGCTFDPKQPDSTFGIKQYFPTDSWRKSEKSENLIIGVDQGAFYSNRLVGSLQDRDKEISWDLTFEPSSKTFHHIDQRAKKLFKPKTLICAPNLNVEFSGKVIANREEYHLDRAVGCQQHIWGSKHAESWAWAHCNLFDNEPTAIFEGLAARPRRGPITMPPLTLAYLRYQNEEFYFNSISNLVSAKNRVGDYEWEFTTGDARTRLHGLASTRPEKMLQVEYPDPDGDKTFCINSEISDFKLTLEKRSGRLSKWKTVAELVSNGTTHFEIASRTKHPTITLI